MTNTPKELSIKTLESLTNNLIKVRFCKEAFKDDI